MIDIILAKKYATAFLNSLPDSEKEQGLQNLIEVITALSQNTPAITTLQTPALRADVKKQLITSIGQTFKATSHTQKFLNLLISKNRLTIIKPLLNALRAHLLDLRDEVEVIISIPEHTNEESRQALIEKAKTLAGKKIISEFKIDPEIIGGFKIKINDTVYDGTLNNAIDKLRYAVAN